MWCHETRFRFPLHLQSAFAGHPYVESIWEVNSLRRTCHGRSVAYICSFTSSVQTLDPEKFVRNKMCEVEESFKTEAGAAG